MISSFTTAYKQVSAVALLLLGLGVVQISLAQTEEPRQPSQEEIDLALMIVNDYRTLRASCVDHDNETQKEMCYYRWNVGLWDYKEARKTLRNAGIRSRSDELVAQSQ